MSTPRRALYALFTVSGFAGLIYESVWSHYLGLVLGHAAYAQTLVLAIFMGGMAAGAWLISRWGGAIARPLLVYAAIEALIGLFGLIFHLAFVGTSAWLIDGLVPALHSVTGIALAKWSACALLILPQSILLGATFPLMSVGILRSEGEGAGRTLGALYAANSFGAVLGVLASGFWLIPALGLPGTVATASVLNLALAAAVAALCRGSEPQPAPVAEPVPSEQASRVPQMLVAAALTGLASFFYEIAWVRMLSMVLGTTVQAFELMLSAFIAGLALGSFVIRRRIDRIARPLRFAGYVQVVMGALALLTLVQYDATFDLMAWLLARVPRDDQGYRLFNLGSHALALGVMLPTTMVAGTTLPLFTHALLQRGHGEASVGRIYAANTLGAIAGVLLAVHVVMPSLGLKWVVGLGALTDVTLGVALLAACRPAVARRELVATALAAGVLFVGVLALVQLDPARMAAGVYRTGVVSLAGDTRVTFRRDGKTASIAVLARGDSVTLSTNGKPDATANLGRGEPIHDESTMLAIAAYGLALHPEARDVINIGFGSGMTTHALLGARTLQRVDTVEIESAVIEGARLFGVRSARAYADPRSRVHIEDAKTFLSSQHARYDLVVSEPSNPWVSGVASLFTREFYAQIRAHIRDGGLLLQWAQLYENDLDNLASVFTALGEHFTDYVVYNTNDVDIAVIAAKDRPIGRASEWIFSEPLLAADLARVGIRGPADLAARRLGDRRLLEPLFATRGVPANSDFHPYLAHRAPRTRFLRARVPLTALHRAAVPVVELLGGKPAADGQAWTVTPHFTPTQLQQVARFIHASVTGAGAVAAPEPRPAGTLEALGVLGTELGRCGGGLAPEQLEPRLHDALHGIAALTGSLLTAAQARELWTRLRAGPCFEQHSAALRAWFALYEATGTRNAQAMLGAALRVLALALGPVPRAQLEYVLTAGTVAALVTQGAGAALDFFGRAHAGYRFDDATPIELQLVVSTAARRAGKL